MRVMAFMSGTGTNIQKLLEHQNLLDSGNGAPFEVTGIFSDRSDGSCAGEEIARRAGIPYFSYDIRRFHKLRGIKRSVASEEGMRARREYDALARRLLQTFDIDVVALGGFMSYTTITRAVNVHPADLAILDEAGNRKYVGDKAVKLAILDGCRSLRSSVIWIDEGVDTGPILVRSAPVPVIYPDGAGAEDFSPDILRKNRALLKNVVKENQDALKERGDWKIFPLAIQWIAEGRFAADRENRLYFDGTPIPDGVTLE